MGTLNQPDVLESIILGIAHELNNPNAFIRVNASNLKKLIALMRPFMAEVERTDPAARVGPYSPGQAVVKMHQLAEGILDASVRLIAVADKLKSCTSHSLKELAEFPLRDLITQMLSHHGFLAAGIKTLEVDFESPNDPYLIKGHSLQIDQALSILLTNAIDAIQERFKGTARDEGELRVQISRPSQAMIEIRFTDNGCGMDEATLEKIFVPYFSTKPQGVGDGIGLSLCRSIITRHGGQITVKSVKGEKTVFSVLLPALTNEGNLP